MTINRKNTNSVFSFPPIFGSHEYKESKECTFHFISSFEKGNEKQKLCKLKPNSNDSYEQLINHFSLDSITLKQYVRKTNTVLYSQKPFAIKE